MCQPSTWRSGGEQRSPVTVSRTTSASLLPPRTLREEDPSPDHVLGVFQQGTDIGTSFWGRGRERMTRLPRLSSGHYEYVFPQITTVPWHKMSTYWSLASSQFLCQSLERAIANHIRSAVSAGDAVLRM